MGTQIAAALLIAAGDNPERLHSEASLAHLCGVAPIPASSGENYASSPQPWREPSAVWAGTRPPVRTSRARCTTCWCLRPALRHCHRHAHCRWKPLGPKPLDIYRSIARDPATRAYVARRTAEGRTSWRLSAPSSATSPASSPGAPGSGSRRSSLPMRSCQCALCGSGLEHPDREYHRQMNLFMSRLDEQQRRWYLAVESQRLGHGADRLLFEITGVDEKTIRRPPTVGRLLRKLGYSLHVNHRLTSIACAVDRSCATSNPQFQVELSGRECFGLARAQSD